MLIEFPAYKLYNLPVKKRIYVKSRIKAKLITLHVYLVKNTREVRKLLLCQKSY
jgi:hypothetical protein